jgi:predicted TPR repeat methyltransferase
MTSTNLEQARQLFAQGNGHFEAGRFGEARASFEAALALAPGRASLLTNLGATHLALGQWHDALAVLQQAAAADPGQSDVWRYLGLAHRELGQWQPAIDCLRRTSELEPSNDEAWVLLAQTHLRLGQVDQALAAFDAATTHVPGSAMAWSERGNLLREVNRLDEAAQCFEKALALGADPELHGYYLAAVKAAAGEQAPAAMPLGAPARYVEALFDQYATEFQDHLVDNLRYRGHETLVRPLAESGRRYGAVLDLGCGSGLCGSIIRPVADALDGVDLSGAMIEQARKLGIYRSLTQAELGQFLFACTGRYDLVLAGDVLTYVGDLSGVFRSVRRILNPGGRFALTLERAPEGANAGEDVRLQPSLRYAHSEAAVRRVAEASGFTVSTLFAAPLREDALHPLQGLYAYLD